MNYNAVISVESIADSGGLPLVVSLTEMKDYLRLQGFLDSDSSPSTDLGDFDFDNTLIEDMITSATELIEETAGISLRLQTMEAVITNLCGMIEIPYGPVISITSLKDSEGTVIPVTGYTVVGNLWKYLKSPCYKNMTMEYEVGYLELPKVLKLDVMRLVAYLYDHRGGDAMNRDFVSQLVSKYSRKTAIA